MATGDDEGFRRSAKPVSQSDRDRREQRSCGRVRHELCDYRDRREQRQQNESLRPAAHRVLKLFLLVRGYGGVRVSN